MSVCVSVHARHTVQGVGVAGTCGPWPCAHRGTILGVHLIVDILISFSFLFTRRISFLLLRNNSPQI